MACVYVVTHKLTGRSYVGRSIQPVQRRWNKHLLHARQGSMLPFHRALWKHGASAFEWVVVWEGTSERVDDVERDWILVFGDFNCTEGGEGTSGWKHRPETRNQMSEGAKSRCQRPPPNVGTLAALKVHAGAKRPASWRKNISDGVRKSRATVWTTPEERRSWQAQRAREYYRANRESILERKRQERLSRTP